MSSLGVVRCPCCGASCQRGHQIGLYCTNGACWWIENFRECHVNHKEPK